MRAGKVKLVYRHFAFLGPESQAAAEAVECAREQGRFWDYHDILFQRQGRENSGAYAKDKLLAFGRELGLNGEAFGSCLESGKYRQRVQDDRQEGQRMSVRSTPTFFIGNTKIEGNLPYERFRAVIEETLAR
ncbi:MAG TPA: DsbA family protein [Dehalococcoidia bacterium]|nr:DsbA family protein [Dehalococcoidia bacterium]